MQGRCRVVSGSGKVKYEETVFSWNNYHTAVYSNKLTTSNLPIVFPFLVNISANLCKDLTGKNLKKKIRSLFHSKRSDVKVKVGNLKGVFLFSN